MANISKPYKWGLFSDYGMRILNETFATKREAWIEKVPMNAKGRFD